MITVLDKALVAILPALLLWLNQKFGYHFDTTPETMTVLAGAISSILVYFVPNKGATP